MTNPSEDIEYATPLIDAAEARRRQEAGAVIIDVRGDESRVRDGIVPGSVRGDRNNLDAQFLPQGDSPDRIVEIADLDQEIVVVCGSPRGSGPVADHLRERGFTNVTHVEGGFPAWRDAGNPVAAAE